MRDLAKNIRVLRQMQGVTQTRLAELVGVSPAYISQIESMTRTPSMENVQKIADALGTPVGALLGEDLEGGAGSEIAKLRQVRMLKSLINSLEGELEERFRPPRPPSASDE